MNAKHVFFINGRAALCSALADVDRPTCSPFIYNKAIVDSRLRLQSCCHLANFIEMQEIVDCKLDANNE